LAITLNVVWVEREFDAYKLTRCMCPSKYNVSEIQRDIRETRSSAVAERPRDALSLSVVSFNIQLRFLLLVTAASDLNY